MSIQRIDHAGCRSHGYQARWPDPLNTGVRWTRFFADDTHGGDDEARLRAEVAERGMRERAAEMRAQREGVQS